MFAFISRALFTNIAMLYANIHFINTLSAKQYSSLLYYVSVFMLLIYFVQFLDEKYYKKIFDLVSLLTVVSVTVMLFFSKNHFFVYAFAISASLLDMISMNYYPQIVQESVKPSQFHKFFNSFSKAEIFGKVSAGAIALLLAQFHALPIVAILLWSLFVVHTYYFFRVFNRYYLPNMNVKVADPVKEFKAAAKIFSQSNLAQLVVFFVSWGVVIRFLIDSSFYQSVEAGLQSKTAVASYLASVDLGLNITSFILVQIATPYVIRRFSLSQALSFAPVVIIIVGLLALFFNPMLFLTVLEISYFCLFRAVQRPLVRQCSTVIPPMERRKLAIFLNLVPAFVSLVASAALKFGGAHFDITLLIMMCVFLAVVLFLLISQLDSLYVRNLWSHTLVQQEDTGLSPFADSILTMQASADNELAENAVDVKHTREHLTLSQRIEKTYRNEFNPVALLKMARLHATRLVREGNYLRDELGAIVYKFKPSVRDHVFNFLKRDWDYDFYQTDEYKNKIERIESFLSDVPISHLNLVIQQKLRRYLAAVFSKPSYPGFSKIHLMLKYDAYLIQDMVELLLDPELDSYHAYLFEAIDDGGVFRLSAVIENLEFLDYKEAAPLRKMIAGLSKHYALEVEDYVENSYLALETQEFHILKADTHGIKRENFNRFLNTIYLNELILKPKSVSKMIRDSIEKLVDAQHEDYEMMLEIHRRFLLKSRFQNHIVAMM